MLNLFNGKRWACATAAAVIAGGGVAEALQASPLRIGDDELAVAYTAGEGEHTAYMVLDYDASDGGVYAFAYQWSDPETTGADMLRALTDEGSLAVDPSEMEDPIFVEDFLYQGEQGTSDRDWSTYSWNQSEMGWTGAWVGLSELLLSEGPVYGEDALTNAWVLGMHQSWYFDPEVGDEGSWLADGEPRATVIPEPASLALLATGGMVVLLRRRRGQH